MSADDISARAEVLGQTRMMRLTQAQKELLRRLEAAPHQRLATGLGVGVEGAQTADALVRKGLAARACRLVCLTKKGREALKNLVDRQKPE